jgi:hypothetical protein
MGKLDRLVAAGGERRYVVLGDETISLALGSLHGRAAGTGMHRIELLLGTGKSDRRDRGRRGGRDAKDVGMIAAAAEARPVPLPLHRGEPPDPLEEIARRGGVGDLQLYAAQPHLSCRT